MNTKETKEKSWPLRIYAIGYAITFAYLEFNSFIDAVRESTGIIDFIFSEMILDFGYESMMNAWQAAMWPWYLLAWLTA